MSKNLFFLDKVHGPLSQLKAFKISEADKNSCF